MTHLPNINKQNVSSLHSSIIVCKGRILAEGYNSPGRKIFGCHVPSVHAEVSVIHKLCNHKHKHSKLTLIVVRYNRQGNLCNSKPCYYCADLMKKIGINKVIYSDNDGNLVTIKVKDLTDCYISRGIAASGVGPIWRV